MITGLNKKWIFGFGKLGIMNNEVWIINNKQEVIGITRRTNHE